MRRREFIMLRGIHLGTFRARTARGDPGDRQSKSGVTGIFNAIGGELGGKGLEVSHEPLPAMASVSLAVVDANTKR
jgi:hypothetical protein